MRILYVALFFSYSLNMCAMHGDKHVQAARKHVQNVLQTSGPAQQKHLTRANTSIELALGNYPNGSTSELQTFKAFVRGIQAFEKDDCNEALSNCVDVIRAPFNTPLLQQVRTRAFHIVQDLSDEKKHTLSRFFFMKSLLNSTKPENVQGGLDRFDTLFAHNVAEEDYVAMATLFRHSEIMVDIRNIADARNDAHAQCIMARYHFFLAERGTEMDGTPTEPRTELKKALQYAEKSVEGHYAPSKELLATIRIAIERRDVQSPRQIASSIELFEEEIPPEKQVLSKTIPPLKLLCALEVWKNSVATDHRQLYERGKKLLDDPCDQVWLVGKDYLKKAAQLGNPFAAERLGDELFDSDPVRAIAYYEIALYVFTHAPPGSLYKLAGCFKRQALECKIGKMCELHEEVSAYQLACEYGQAAAREKWVYDGLYNKNHVDALASCIHSLEAEYARNKHTVDTLFLERVKTSGALRFMELFCEHPPIQDVLIEVFALRANVGRGFVLEEKTILAHYKKALHFILDPDGASKAAFKDSVPAELLLKKVQLDALPLQQRLIYVDAMLGVITQLTQEKLVEKKAAEYICQLFVVVDEAIRQTADTYLKNLACERYVRLLDGIRQAALLSGSREHLYVVGRCHADIGLQNGSLEALEVADKLFTRVPQGKGAKLADLLKKLAQVKVARAETAQARNDTQTAQSFIKKALQLCPDDVDVQWQCSQVLVNSGQMELRAEGVSLIEKLAQTGHREAQTFMVSGYYGKMPHIIALDMEKAIPLLVQLIQSEPVDYTTHRIMLANIYAKQASQATGTYRQKLIAKALDLARLYARTFDDSHLMYTDLLRASKRAQEALSELLSYQPTGQLTEKRVYELASAYLERATGPSGQIRQAFQTKGIMLLRSIKDTSERAYLLLLEALFEQHQFDQLAQELAVKKEPHMNCLNACYRARVLLLQRKRCQFDEVLLHCEQAFAAFEDHFLRTAAQDAQDLMDLISSVGVSECVAITHPMKATSLEHIVKVNELLSLVIIQGDCDDQERMRMLAYNAYFTAKIALLCLGKEATYDDVIKMLSKAQEAACDACDVACKSKLLILLDGQTRFWLDTPDAGTLAMRAKTAVQLLMICARLCKDEETELLHIPFHDIVIYVNDMLCTIDLVACKEEDVAIVRLQQQIVSRLLDNVKKQ